MLGLLAFHVTQPHYIEAYGCGQAVWVADGFNQQSQLSVEHLVCPLATVLVVGISSLGMTPLLSGRFCPWETHDSLTPWL